MPKGLSGFELARQALRLSPGIKVLLTSGYPLADKPNPEQFRLLPKPFRSGELASAVAALMAGPSGPLPVGRAAE